MFGKKVAKRFLRSPKVPNPNQDPSASTIANVSCAFTSVVFLIGTTIFSIVLFVSAVSIRNNLGNYINMVASGDGDILPALQAVPALFFLLLNFTLGVVTCKLFEAGRSPTLNCILFVVLMLTLLLIFVVFILVFVVIQHIYKAHEELHNGIVDAMKNYSSDSLLKRRMDRLQIDFQCCGSKKYDEWYNITWYDSNLVKKGTYEKSQGNTPYSCCSMSSTFPCIHHNIESTGKVYLYTPELNLSISTKGCYSMLRQRKQEFGWGIIGNLVLYIVLQGALVIFLRFIQTAHCENSKFDGHKRLYTIWLIGCYTAKNRPASPPDPPPVPPELME